MDHIADLESNSCIDFLLNCIANSNVEPPTRTTFWKNFIKHVKTEITQRKTQYNLFSKRPGERIGELNKILDRFSALIRYEFGCHLQNDLAIELIFFIEDIVSVAEQKFRSRQNIKFNEMIHRALQLYRMLTEASPEVPSQLQLLQCFTNLLDPCISRPLQQNDSRETIFLTEFDPTILKVICKTCPPNHDYRSKIRRVVGKEANEICSQIPKKSHRSKLPIRKVAAGDIYVENETNTSEKYLLSEELRRQKLSIIPMSGNDSRIFTAPFETTIKIVKWISPTLLWAVEGLEDIEKWTAVVEATSNQERDQLIELDDGSNIGHISFAYHLQSNSFVRVKLLETGDWFCIDTGSAIDRSGHLTHYKLPNSIFETESLLTLIKLDKIAPTSVDVNSTMLFFSILNKALTGAQVSQQVQQIPHNSVIFALNTLNNYECYNAETRRYAAGYLKQVAQLKHSTRLTPTEENKIKNENEYIESDAAIVIFMKNIVYELDNIETNQVSARLLQIILSIFYTWTTSNVHYNMTNRIDYRVAIKCVEMDIVQHIHRMTKATVCRHAIHLQKLAIALLKNFCGLATLYGDHQTILRDQTESRELRTFYHDEIQLFSQINFETNDQVTEIADSRSVPNVRIERVEEPYGIHKLLSEQIYERQRINEFEVMEDEFTVFHRADSFETIKDGLIADFASALLNGRSRGTLWLGLSPDGMITGVSANSSGKDKFKQRMFKLMRTMFPPVMTQHFKINFIEIRAVEEQQKCLVRLTFVPNGLMYSTPQKRCCIRTEDGNTQVLDTGDIVRRCMQHEERAFRIQINQFKRQIESLDMSLKAHTT